LGHDTGVLPAALSHRHHLLLLLLLYDFLKRYILLIITCVCRIEVTYNHPRTRRSSRDIYYTLTVWVRHTHKLWPAQRRRRFLIGSFYIF
jgi:hypothetical protein